MQRYRVTVVRTVVQQVETIVETDNFDEIPTQALERAGRAAPVFWQTVEISQGPEVKAVTPYTEDPMDLEGG